MKLVAIIGSPRGMDGATGPVLQAVLDATGAEVELFNLARLEVAPCVACDACHKVGRCAIRDDYQAILAAMTEADAIVLASPNYIMSVTAQMKALFDRCCGPIHRMALAGKCGAAVVTSGSEDSAEVETYMQRYLGAMGAWTVGSVGASGMELHNPATRADVLERAAELGRRLAAAVQAGQPIAEQEPALAAFRARMQGLVRMQKDTWRYEYEWWLAHGMEA
jgi:multimeric flavodoxin WrbA